MDYSVPEYENEVDPFFPRNSASLHPLKCAGEQGRDAGDLTNESLGGIDVPGSFGHGSRELPLPPMETDDQR